MLLELDHLRQTLEKAGIVPAASAARIKTYSETQVKQLTFEVRLAHDGRVVMVAEMAKAKVEVLRQFRLSSGSGQETTPSFSTKKPPWDNKAKNRVNKCLKEASSTLFALLNGKTEIELFPLRELLRRCQLTDADQLSGQLIAMLRSDPKWLKHNASNNLSLVLELDDFAPYGAFPANHETVWNAVNHHLIDAVTTDSKANNLDVFGEKTTTKLDKMHGLILKVVGSVKLFSLSKNSRCQERYGLIESAACPVSPEKQIQLAAALQWITDTSRKGLTWADVTKIDSYIPEKSRKKKAKSRKKGVILLAYPSSMPKTPMGLCLLLASDTSNNDTASVERTFEQSAAVTLKHLHGEIDRDPALDIIIMMIAKVDDARKKLIYSRQFRADRLRTAAEEWQSAAKNIPPITLRIFENGRPTNFEPIVPFPNQVVRIINTCWKSNGEQPQAISNARVGLGLTLLLESGTTVVEAAREALRTLVCNVTPFILALVRAQGEAKVYTGGGPPITTLLVPSVLALVMTKAESFPTAKVKGAYMQENAYLIGRLLNLADEYHRQYCDHMRKGDRPPQLIGNALFLTALEDPKKGLAALAGRLTLYQRTADEQLRDEAGKIEQAIDKATLGNRCSDVEKAQMLLGYLARPDFKSDPAAS